MEKQAQAGLRTSAATRHSCRSRQGRPFRIEACSERSSSPGFRCGGHQVGECDVVRCARRSRWCRRRDGGSVKNTGVAVSSLQPLPDALIERVGRASKSEPREVSLLHLPCLPSTSSHQTLLPSVSNRPFDRVAVGLVMDQMQRACSRAFSGTWSHSMEMAIPREESPG
jgi:hypothetical protein